MINTIIAALISTQIIFDDYGQTFITITNVTDLTLYCEIIADDVYDYHEFTLYPRQTSRRYREPSSPYSVECD